MNVTRQLRGPHDRSRWPAARTERVSSPMRTVPATAIDCSNRLAGYCSLPRSLPVPVP